MTAIDPDATPLHAVEAGAGLPLLLLHGFTGSHATWLPFLDRWGGVRKIAVDLLGHGSSECPHDRTRYDIDHTVRALLTVLEAKQIERAVVLGYSMGGRIALRLALAAPERIRALILESTSPGITDASSRQARIEADEALADQIERESVERFVGYWEALPLWASQARLSQSTRDRLRAQRLRNTPQGLANSLRGVGAGRMLPVHDQLSKLSTPALLIAGTLDTRYCDEARAMAAKFPTAMLTIVNDAGHAVHLEQPEAFRETVAMFLAPLR